MPLTPIEKQLLASLAEIATFAAEIGKTQTKMANFIVQHLPNLTEDEKQKMLGHASTSWKQQQQLQDRAEKLRKAL